MNRLEMSLHIVTPGVLTVASGHRTGHRAGERVVPGRVVAHVVAYLGASLVWTSGGLALVGTGVDVGVFSMHLLSASGQLNCYRNGERWNLT